MPRSLLLLLLLLHGGAAANDSPPNPPSRGWSTPALRDSVETADGVPWKRHTIDNTSRGADGVKPGDINGDGLTDLVTGWEEGGEVRLYLHPGYGATRQPWPRVTVGKVRDAEDAILADIDGDGRLDIVSCTEGKTRAVFRHRFTGQPGGLLQADKWITAPFPAAAGQLWMQAAALDVDGQHGTDLILASKGKDATISWLQAPARAQALDQWTLRPLREAGWLMSLTPHDFDDNGDLDLLFTDRKGPRSGVFWLENPGPGRARDHARWTEHAIGGAGREVMFADVADLDGDGLMDVVAAVKPAEIIVFLRQKDRTWRTRTLALIGTNIGDAKAVKAADLNGDGLTDLVFTCENAAGLREGIVWLEQQNAGVWK